MIHKIMIHINSMGKGGAERVVANLAACFVQKEIEVVVATEWNAEDEYSLDERVRRVHVGLMPEEEHLGRYTLRRIRKNRLHNLIIKEKPDVVLAFCRNANFRAIAAAVGTGVPVIYSVRNDPVTYYSSFKEKTLASVLYKKAAGGVFQTNDAVTFFSAAIRNKATVIMNPLGEKYLHLSQAQTRRKAIVSVGRITDAKGQITLIKAFEKLSGDYPEYSLEIYGEPSEDNTCDILAEYVSEHKLSERVFFKGNSNTLEKDIIDAAVFVLPSKYEGMPNALMEAMAMGLPVISTDCPCKGPAMLINEGENGYLVPVGDEAAMADKIKFFLDNPSVAQKCGQKAAEIVQKADPEAVADRWLEYIEKCIPVV